MMAPAFCWKEASTEAMAMVCTVGVGLGTSERSSADTLLWNMTASASRQILLMMATASAGYLPYKETEEMVEDYVLIHAEEGIHNWNLKF